MLERLPKALLSRAAGRVARSPASRALIPWFAHHYGIDRSAAAVPEGGFRSLQQFFCRQLAPGLRPIDATPGIVVSPVDGTLGSCGRIEAGQLWQCKGMSYALEALLGGAEGARRYLGGTYCTLYLAPHDYHRVHAPAAGRVPAARYLPGAFWPVHPRAVATIPGLFAANERLITWLDTDAGQMAVVMVGACLVGGIRVNYDPAWNAGPGPHRRSERQYQPAPRLERGEELGRFEFGSTVVLLLEKGAEVVAAAGSQLHFGEALIRLG